MFLAVASFSWNGSHWCTWSPGAAPELSEMAGPEQAYVTDNPQKILVFGDYGPYLAVLRARIVYESNPPSRTPYNIIR